MSNNLSQTSTFRDADLNQLVVSKPIQSTVSKGKQNMYIGAAGRKPFRFQLSAPDGVVTPTVLFAPEEQPATPGRVTMAVSISTKNDDIIEFWGRINDIVIKHVALHSKEFLKTQHTYEEVAAKFTSALRTKEGYDPYLKIRFDISKDSRCPFSCCCANIGGKKFAKIEWQDLHVGDGVVCIVQLGMIYCVNGLVGYTVDCSSILKYAPPPPNEFPFVLRAGVDEEHFTQCSYGDLWKTVRELNSDDDNGCEQEDESLPTRICDDVGVPMIEFMEHCSKKQKICVLDVNGAATTQTALVS